MSRLPHLLLLLFLVAVHSRADADVPTARLARLTRGVNLSHWFAQTTPDAHRLRTHITPTDLAQIHHVGFRHVRLPLDPQLLLVPGHPDSLAVSGRSHLDDALDRILRADLAVIVELHPREAFKRHLYRESRAQLNLITFWQTLATHLAKRDPERLFLEVLNEPSTADPQDWYALQTRLLQAMRRGAPRHTLIAAANQQATPSTWGSHLALPLIPPMADRNVVYNFHFYAPMPFTHQGTTWGQELLRHFRGLPYPSSPETVAPLLADHPAAVRGLLSDYGREGWNREKIRETLWPVADWARRRKVAVTCNEFGVYRRVAPRRARLTWLLDVRQALEELKIGWAVWDYAGGFSVVVRDDPGGRRPDEGVLQALGLR